MICLPRRLTGSIQQAVQKVQMEGKIMSELNWFDYLLAGLLFFCFAGRAISHYTGEWDMSARKAK